MSATDLYGLTALPASVGALKPSNTAPNTVSSSSLSPPDTPLAKRVQAYVKARLSPDTYRHSMRVYSYGLAIARECFPEWHVEGKLQETWFLTAMLHDIGTTDAIIGSTRLSYEFWAGVHALDLLQNPSVSGGEGKAPVEQAESVAEAIFRHQDVQDKGQVSLVTQLIQLGTLLDNIGAEVPSKWVTRGTIEGVNAMWPRQGWSGCFRGTVEREKALKPYAMVSRIEGFEGMIMANKVTAEGEGN
jgi:cyanamide hydratase